MLAGRRIALVGAGIAGLATARALALRGAQVAVFERAPAISEVGAGIQISPNGYAVLRDLGLGEALTKESLPSNSVTLRDHNGRAVVRLDLAGRGDFRLVHRADLIEVLRLGALEAGVALHLGQEIANPEDLAADLVVGADGLHSIVRGHILTPADPRFTGQTAWRALVPIAHGTLPEGSQVLMGPGRHLVLYPLRGGTLANLVGVVEEATWSAEGWSHPGDPAELQTHFARFGGVAPDLLRAVTEVHRWGLFRHPVAPHWHGQGCTLVGDAAHPTLPFLAQGANLALEDAWALAACLAADWDTGLARYEALRRPRACRVIEAANANARNFHLANPLLRGLAHGLLRGLGRFAPGRLESRFDWLYGYDITTQI